MSNDSIIIHGHLLKEAREDLNLSLEDVARQLTLSSNYSNEANFSQKIYSFS
jgi:transcriptional regulator with XRE-family HTH domain